jgi:PAS domain S-box-containing protein
MKSSADALKSSYGRRRWRVALERRQRDGSLALSDYIEMLRPTAQTLIEALCAVDLAGRIHLVNPSAQRLLGCAEPDLLGRSIHEVLCCSAQEIRDGAARDASGLSDALALHANVELDACELRGASGVSIPVQCALRSITHAGHSLGAMLTLAEPAALQPLETRETYDSERRMRVLEVVGDIALAQLPLDDLLSALLDALRLEMSLENAAIFLVNDEGDTVIARAASGAGAESADSIRVPLGQGVIGEAMRTRRPLFLSEISPTAPHSDEFSAELRASMNVQSLVMMPLIVEERVIGVLYLGASEPHRFTKEDVRLVELVGERAALAIERAHASDEAARAHERLRFLNDASGALNATLNYHDTTQRLAAIATPALADACAVYLLEDDGLLRKVASQAPARGLLTTDPNGVALQRLVERLDAAVEVNPDDTSSAIGRCIQSLTPVFERYPVSPASPASPADDDAAGAEASGCLCVCAPLVVRQHAVGALYLAIRPGKEFADGDLALIQGLAERAAVAIDNARLYIETQQALASGSATATQLDTIFNATDVGIFVTNAHGAFLRINPYGAHLLGMSQDAVEQGYTGANAPFELRTPEGEPIPLGRDPLHLARTQGRAIEQRIIIHVRSSGKDIQALTRCSPWFNERRQIAGAIGVVTDITAISELERQKDEFLGIASHELKTPLTSLKILAQLLARKMQASGELRELEQAQRMQVAITRMERLIRDLLDVTLIQEGKLALHEELTDLGDICAEAVGEQAVLSQRTIQFTPPEQDSLLVYADSERIYQVISNLLSNALKYSPATTQVVVRTRATERECIVSVQDHGPGVPPEAVEQIFDRFYRVPGMQVQSGSGVGLGLGLHISKDIVERHGGSIWVESKLGHGSVFSIALPRASA